MTATSRSPSADVLLPQELKDNIVSHLSSDRSALLACCLAHRTLRATAQPHLFRSIYISRDLVAQRLRWALDAFPYLRSYVHKLVIAELDYDDPGTDGTMSMAWIGRVYAEVASIIAALPHLPSLALRVVDTYFYSGLKTIPHAIRRISPAALELIRLQDVPPELFAGVRALRLVDVSIDERASPCICTPVALELCNIGEDDFAALLFDTRKLIRLRLHLAPEEASELVARGAATLQMLEVDEFIISPQVPLLALRVLAVRDPDTACEWLRAAPGVRHLIVHIQLRIHLAIHPRTGNLVNLGMDMMGLLLLDAGIIAEGRALEVVTLVAYSGEKSERRWCDVAGSYRYGERDVEIRYMRVPQPSQLDNLSHPSLLDPDILDGNWA